MDNEMLRELQLFHNHHGPCNFLFTLTLLGNRWAPWFLSGNWFFYSRDLLGLISLREIKDHS